MSSDPQAVDPAAIFLGPKGENADVMERLLLEAFRDHVFWRRNFHPEDGFIIREQDKRTTAYETTTSVLAQELFGLLAELKAGVPFFSPRYIGHMTSDATMASVIGYFATMLYNPNNVGAEGSPVTTKLELEVAAQLAAMIGYDPARQWGHLTSGGTIANIEALWVARELKYLPLALRGAIRETTVRDVPVRLGDGSETTIDALELWELLNVTPEATLDALEAFAARMGDAQAASDAVTRHSLSGLGHQEFGVRLVREFGDGLPPAVVLVPSTAHYSWAKACRALGTGERQLVHVPVDARFRMDVDALDDILRGLAERRQPVVACVSVLGTTEESAVDRVDLVADARDQWAARGLGFYLHVDAAWGGYAAAVTRGADGARRSLAAARADLAPIDWPDEGVYGALCALDRTDSVTIDPHKLGYVPYPAGAVSFRDRRVKELVAVEAPYVFHRGVTDVENIGRFILEGSKPGAAAAGVWMSHQVLPLDARGYGRLVGDTVRGALALYDGLRAADVAPFSLALLPRPDMNIVCFVPSHPSLDSLEALNAFVGRVYAAMSIGEDHPLRALDYVVTKTTLRAREYGRAALPIVERLGFSRQDYERAGGLAVIRCTVMNPFLSSPHSKVDHIAGFIATLRDVMRARLGERRATP